MAGGDVKSILKLAKKEYRRPRDNGEWPSDNHARDSKLGSRGYRSVNIAATTELKHFVNSLIKSDDKPKVKGAVASQGTGLEIASNPRKAVSQEAATMRGTRASQ